MYAIDSSNLERRIWVVETPEEGRQLVSQGEPRSNIYSADEIQRLKGISVEGLKAVQRAKDAFPGSIFEGYHSIEGEDRPHMAPLKEEPPERPSSTTDQMSLL